MDLDSVVEVAGAAATGVLFLLVGLSVVQVAIVVERTITLFHTRLPQQRLRRLTGRRSTGQSETSA